MSYFSPNTYFLLYPYAYYISFFNLKDINNSFFFVFFNNVAGEGMMMIKWRHRIENN